MDPFSIVAGVVGLIASIDSIINLFKRLTGQLSRSNQEDYARAVTMLETYKQLKELADPKGDLTEEQATAVLLCNQAIYPHLCKLEIMITKSPSGVFGGKKVGERLDKIHRILSSVDVMINMSSKVRAARVDDSLASSSSKVIKQILDPKNRQPVTRQDLIRNQVYSQGSDFDFSNSDRLLQTDDGVFFVETIPVGTTQKMKASRMNRLGKLILVSKGLTDLPGLVRMEKMIEQDGNFHILGRVDECCRTKSMVSTLEGQLGSSAMLLDDETKKRVLFSLAEAVTGLHKCHIVHESISSNNILVIQQQQQLRVKLAGFLFARIADPLEMSERERSANDRYHELRKIIYQAPERLAGGRYSFECDVYSMGVVMAEVALGKSFVSQVFVNSILPSYQESILSLLSSTTDSLSACIRDCLSADASNRPSALEVYDRLQRL